MNERPEISALRAIPLLSTLSDKALQRLQTSQLVQSRGYKPGDYILRQGDRGESMFLIHQGRVEIRINSINDREITIGSLKNGDFFGEQALLPGSDGRRNASIRAQTPLTLFEIPRRVLDLPRDEEEEDNSSLPLSSNDDQDLREMLDQMALFRSLNMTERYTLFASLDLLYCTPGQIVITSSQPNDDLYIVLQGLLEMYLEPNPGNLVPIATLDRGHYFGEQALLDRPEFRRLVNVRSVNTALLGRLPGEQFRKLVQDDEQLQASLRKRHLRILDRIKQQSRHIP